jgi:uncharacterized cofD-like protein
MNTVHEKIVLIGGGGGVYRLARFLKRVRSNITTIQTMFDHGGHSGKLRDERGALPPGDIRQAILALSDDEIGDPLRILLSHRFSKLNGSSIDDATIGNLILTALTEHYRNPIMAIDAMCKIFQVKGRVLPVSLDHAELCARLSDESIIIGEGKIDTRSEQDERTIVSVHLSPQAHIYVGAYQAIAEADTIIFCPGDLFTSIIPNTLVSGFRQAIAESKAKLVYVVNLVTKQAETPRFTASRFVSTLLQYIGKYEFDTVIINSAEIDEVTKTRYALEHSYPVEVDIAELKKYAKTIIIEDLVDQTSEVLRHNQRIATIIASLK